MSALALENQAAFRALMDVMARPGDVREMAGVSAPAPLSAGAAALLRSLADYETPIWLDAPLAGAPAVMEWIRFHTGAPLTADASAASFAMIAAPLAMSNFDCFALGSEEYPDRSTTLIVQIERFAGPALTLSGPGIKTTRRLSAEPLPPDFHERLRLNRALFPRGVDLVLVAGTRIAALPRSVTVKE